MNTDKNNKEFKDIKPGDVILASKIGCLPAWGQETNLLVIEKDNKNFRVIGVANTKGFRSHDTYYIDFDNYNACKSQFNWYQGDNVKFDITPIREQLLELPVTQRILPPEQRINESVLNLVEEGELPTFEEMRLLLLRYHKALTTAETNVELYNKILFDDGLANRPDETENISADISASVNSGIRGLSGHFTSKYFTEGDFGIYENKKPTKVKMPKVPSSTPFVTVEEFKWNLTGTPYENVPDNIWEEPIAYASEINEEE